MDWGVGVAVAAGDAVLGGVVEGRVSVGAFVHAEGATVVEVAAREGDFVFVSGFLFPAPLGFWVRLRNGGYEELGVGMRGIVYDGVDASGFGDAAFI